jgi:phage terminase small subunit
MDHLTEKQRRFCEEYIIDLNATKAAIRAGYSQNTARQISSENLSKPDIQEYLTQLQRERSQRVALDADWVLRRLRENVERAMQATPVLDRNGNDTGVYRYEGAVANRALELIGRHLGMFNELSEDERIPRAQIAIQSAVAVAEIAAFRERYQLKSN